MNASRICVAAALAALTLAGFYFFPGHTWLQSDTQIYVPILQHLEDSSVLKRDIVATRPHVRWTVYDEVAVIGRSLTGLEYRELLEIQQVIFRFAGIGGAYLLGLALTGGAIPALFVAACFGLGATVNGPAVLTLEYEPVPRGFAVLLITCALGLAAHSRWLPAAAAAAIALVYHPPTAALFWFCAVLWRVFQRGTPAAGRLLAPFPAGVVLLALIAFLQHGEREAQDLFGRIEPGLESLQKMRGMYNWISLWPREWFWQYPLLFCVVVAAWLRLRREMPLALRWFSIVFPAAGLLTMPLSYLLLDVGKWSLLPQLQPARNVLFITFFAVILGAAAAWRAGSKRKLPESFAWLFVVFAIPANGVVFPLIPDAFTAPIAKRRLIIVVALAACGMIGAWLAARRKAAGAALAAASICGAIWLIPSWGGMKNFAPLHSPELDQLAAWARASTPKDAVFLFADAHRRLEPGVFRAQAQRALYVDWKGGGQVNLLKIFAFEWWRRWRAVNEARPPLRRLEDYRDLGIDYVVVTPANRPSRAAPVFANSEWEVVPTS